MVYKNMNGIMIDTDKENVICPLCHQEISKIEIDNDDVYHDGVDNLETGENWCELLHSSCAEKASEQQNDKRGY
jgi:hypothetical protein